MKLNELTPEIVTPVIEAVVAEYGEDYEYDFPGDGDCVYEDEGEPSCIVGHVMSRLGVDTTGWDDRRFPSYGNIYREALDAEGYHAVHVALFDAQFEQDCGAPWGIALESYRSTLKRLGAKS